MNEEAQAAEAQPAEAKPIDVFKIISILKTNNGARMRTWLNICARCGLCADSCLFYLAHGKDPVYSPAYKVKKTLGEMYRRKGVLDRAWLEEAKEIVWGQCTVCRRCSMFCPFGIDLASMIGLARSVCCSQGILPARLAETRDNILKTGNQMAMSNEDWVEACQWMAEEYEEELSGIEIPVDKKGVKYMYTVNPREPMYYPQDLGMMAMILTVAEESWTMPSYGWDCTNLAMFAGDRAAAAVPVKNMYQAARELGVQSILMTECGHAYRSGVFEGPYYLGLPGGKPPLPIKHSVQLFWEYIVRDGRIKIDPEKMIKEPATVQDPCNVSRNGGLWEMLRELTRALCTDFRDMSPNREYNHCCGGGGGFIPMGPEYKKRRLESGRVKVEQLKETGAKIIIAPCHNCFDQLRDLNIEYELGAKVVSFKDLITESMVIPDKFKIIE
ncbi:MAG: (Fe-S)-binding protein [Thermodesulfobacteriota bacterium]